MGKVNVASTCPDKPVLQKTEETIRDMLFLDQNLVNRKEMFKTLKTVGHVRES